MFKKMKTSCYVMMSLFCITSYATAMDTTPPHRTNTQVPATLVRYKCQRYAPATSLPATYPSTPDYGQAFDEETGHPLAPYTQSSRFGELPPDLIPLIMEYCFGNYLPAQEVYKAGLSEIAAANIRHHARQTSSYRAICRSMNEFLIRTGIPLNVLLRRGLSDGKITPSPDSAIIINDDVKGLAEIILQENGAIKQAFLQNLHETIRYIIILDAFQCLEYLLQQAEVLEILKKHHLIQLGQNALQNNALKCFDVLCCHGCIKPSDYLSDRNNFVHCAVLCKNPKALFYMREKNPVDWIIACGTSNTLGETPIDLAESLGCAACRRILPQRLPLCPIEEDSSSDNELLPDGSFHQENLPMPPRPCSRKLEFQESVSVSVPPLALDDLSAALEEHTDLPQAATTEEFPDLPPLTEAQLEQRRRENQEREEQEAAYFNYSAYYASDDEENLELSSNVSSESEGESQED